MRTCAHGDRKHEKRTLPGRGRLVISLCFVVARVRRARAEVAFLLDQVELEWLLLLLFDRRERLRARVDLVIERVEELALRLDRLACAAHLLVLVLLDHGAERVVAEILNLLGRRLAINGGCGDLDALERLRRARVEDRALLDDGWHELVDELLQLFGRLQWKNFRRGRLELHLVEPGLGRDGSFPGRFDALVLPRRGPSLERRGRSGILDYRTLLLRLSLVARECAVDECGIERGVEQLCAQRAGRRQVSATELREGAIGRGTGAGGPHAVIVVVVRDLIRDLGLGDGNSRRVELGGRRGAMVWRGDEEPGSKVA